ncbi:MAG: glycosyltransferase family 2 protein [Pseudomonadales bacterium]|nr:glycosyltransferase family 2 protein [Pseudomonadales bacterium]
MKLTVVMSVFNGQRFVEQAVRSVLEQTFADFDFVAVDNRSTDATWRILQRLADTDRRLRLVRNDRNGTYVEGRTLGIARAETDWVALMDADDVSHPDRLARQTAFIQAHGDGLGAVGTWGRYIDEDGKVAGYIQTPLATMDEFRARYERRDSLVLLDPSAVLHRATFESVGGYRADAVPAADLDLWYRMAESGRAVLAVPEALMDYRVHSGSESATRTMLQRRKTHFVNYNMRRRRDGVDEIGWHEFETRVWARLPYRLPRLRRDLGFTYFKRAAIHFGCGNYARFGATLLLAGVLNPTLVVRRLSAQIRLRRNLGAAGLAATPWHPP